ncbi:DnaD and phage-associated domain-containing protein [Enterococcus casseliflavus]|uniref:DnaD domain protein n=1 Tax=Enterococcus casseliflavus TaxID=37734 RepID=UPI0008F1F35F|nr:DnaD domain protein [Enterococcus casseliflavus]SFD57307.1 DnaD and phage-associated domain-containing protein [Enterococcus casseliflavus]
MNHGYIKLYRKVMDSFVWTNPNMYKLWSLCLMKASHERRKFLFNGKEMWLNSGEFVTGRDAITFEMNKGAKREHQVNSASVWRWLKKFESEQMLNIKSTTKYSVISINNWEEYQGSEQQVNINRTTSEQQVNTYKNEKNDKNEKNNNIHDEEHPAELIQKLYNKFPTGVLQGELARWLQEWPREMICFAIQTSYDYGKEMGSLKPYINRILENWKTNGIDSLEKAIAANNQFKNRNSSPRKKTSFVPQKPIRSEPIPEWFNEEPSEPVIPPERQAEIDAKLAAYLRKTKKE